MSTDTFLCGLIADLETQITAAMAAIAEYSGDGIVSYTYNTGQTNQSVTKESLKAMQAHVDSLLARRDTLRQRCNLDTASFNAAPGY